MTDQNNQNLGDGDGGDDSSKNKQQQADGDLVEKLVKERLEENLKPIKEKLDGAFSQRDEALRKVAEYEKEKRDAEIARLKDEGKHKEAFERQLAEERAAREALEKENLNLTRNNEVRANLTNLDFRNEKAVEMAFQEIVGELVRNEQGTWVHRSGVSVRDFIKTFVEAEENNFLFKAKASSGSGGGSSKGGASNSGPKSLFERPQSEVIKMAAEGKLPKR